MIYTSYFYQIRFMEPHDICFSTALSDPCWFHSFHNKFYTFVDKRGVINGLRCPPLVPGPLCANKCHGPQSCLHKPPNCDFLTAYRKQLNQINLSWLFNQIDIRVKQYQQELKFESTPNVIFLVHEASNNPCSERYVIQHWLKDNGITCEEWEKSRVTQVG